MIGEEDKINEDPIERYDSADDSANVADEMSEDISNDGKFYRGGVVEKMSPGSKNYSQSFSPGQQINDYANFWRKMPLTRVVSITAVHPHALELCTTVGFVQKGKLGKSPDQMSEAEVEDASWQCNGSEVFQGGCKSGQIDFGLHSDSKAWRCFHSMDSDIGGAENKEEEKEEVQECDFDMCEMCIRWSVHCEKLGTDLMLL